MDADTRDLWVKDAIMATADRLIAMKEGTDPDAAKAKEHYDTDVEEYKSMLLNAAKSLKQMELSVTSVR